MQCINLEQALKLSTKFSIYSSEGDIPAELPVPIPSEAFCEFVAKPWQDISPNEREAFQKFYTRVGANLEEVAASVKHGFQLDEVTWEDIIATLR